MTIRSTLAVSFAALLAASTGAGCVMNEDDDDMEDRDDDDDDDQDDDDDDQDDDDDDQDDDQDDDDDDQVGDGDPRSGRWGYVEYQQNQNDCNLDDSYGNGGGSFLLENHGDGTFTVVPGDGTDPFVCQLDGGAFDCPDRATEVVEVEGGYDAVIIGHATAEGIFSDDDSGSGSQTATVSCQGGDCGIVEAATGVDFPCTLEVDFVIEWLEAV